MGAVAVVSGVASVIPPVVAAAADSGGIDLALAVAVILALGVASQVVADRFRVPSILFLIVTGVVLGPEGIGLVTLDLFGDALSTIVGLSVGIIVFEGAFNLRIEDLREAPTDILRLVTIGAAIAFLGTAVAVRFLLDVEWTIAFLTSSLLVATGPTVIAPILQVVPVRDRVGAVLETEGIVNDVTAAILAVVIFEVTLLSGSGSGAFVREIATRLGIGLFVGAAVAGVLWYLLWHIDLSPKSAPQNARLLVLVGAVVAYGAANQLAPESGVAAVAVGGALLGNLGVPYEEQIEEFKGDLTLVVLSFVFIVLAALLDFERLLDLGIGGIAVVVVVALVLRPLLVFVSTIGDRFTRSERLFMSFVAPRGIIPASVATLFALQLRAAGRDPAADALVGTVFLVILTTVVFEGGLARQIGQLLDVIPMRVLLVGGGRVGRALARRLEDRGEDVVIVEKDDEVTQIAREEGFSVHSGDGTNTDVLRAAGADNAKTVVATTGDDDVNLLVAQLAGTKFDAEQVIARANNPANVEAFEDIGVRSISPTTATAYAIDNLIERPTLADWMNELGRSGDVQETTVTEEKLVGITIAQLNDRIPTGVLVALVGRDGDNRVPEPDFELQSGDRITFLGRAEGVREAMEMCHPTDA
ncbi:potassium transporter [Halobacteriales archaeon SW_7_68_16]|nr:MAG: potassium transporter [Halobacteriales archaeon SW_7_68_16]